MPKRWEDSGAELRQVFEPRPAAKAKGGCSVEDEKERTTPGTEDEVRRETDDDPDVEGHRSMPRTEIGRTEVGRTEVGRTETGRTEP
jgi:hypothetical protein